MRSRNSESPDSPLISTLPPGPEPLGDAAPPVPHPPRRRRGRRPADPADVDIARALRRRRELLRLSIREAAQRTGVSHTVISEIERGKRLPTVRTFERLRHGLGLDASPEILVRPPQPVDPLEVHLTRLAACLWASGSRMSLAELGAALGTSAAVVREQLPAVVARLAACGLAVVTDGMEVQLEPLPLAEPALEVMGRLVHNRRVSSLSSGALVVLTYVGWHEEATRSDLQDLRGKDCASVLDQLVGAGFLDVVRDSAGRRDNRYRLTTVAFQALGVASPEELRSTLRPLVGEDALSKLSAGDGTSPG